MKYKGIFLVEMIVVIALIAVLSLALTPIFNSLLGDIPRTFHAFNTNKTVNAFLSRLQNDLDRAQSLPLKTAGHISNDDLLLIKLPEGTIAYQKQSSTDLSPAPRSGSVAQLERIVRYNLKDGTSDPNSPQFNGRIFSVPNTRINWHVWQDQGRAFAVEVTTSLALKYPPGAKKILANSHVFFIYTHPGIDMQIPKK